MLTFLITVTAASLMAFFLLEEHRKKIRIVIVALLVVDVILYMSPTARCAADTPIVALRSLNLDAVKFQYEMCQADQMMAQLVNG